MDHPELIRLRDIAMGLPGVSERVSHGAPCFYVSRKALAYFHSKTRLSFWCPVGDDYQSMRLFSQPDRFFAPTTSQSGHFRDWIGMYLDAVDGTGPDWDDVCATLIHAYRRVAGKKLQAQLSDP